MNPPILRPAVFLDRDGTIIDDVDYLTDPGQIRLIPGASEAIRRLNEEGWAVVVVTNQSAVARGMLTEDGLGTIHQRLKDMLAGEGAHLDAIYYCPHLAEGGSAPYDQSCDCRKPASGMLRQAAREHRLDLAASAIIGDSLRDLDAGATAGCKTLILVRTGHGATEEAASMPRASFVADDLGSAVTEFLSRR